MRRVTGRDVACLVLGGAVLVGGLTACSSSRSVEAFCGAMETHKQAYLEQMSAANGQGMGGILQSVSALGDLKLMWDELADVAPSEIQADTEAVRDAWRKQEDNAGAGNWMSSLSTALLNSGSMSRVDAYVRQNCDGDYSAATTPADPEESSTASTPPVTPEPAPVILEDVWTDGVGYGYTLELNTATGTASKDVANAAPGSANVTWQYSFAGTVENATAKRNAPAPDYVKVQPIWASDSPICALNGMGIARAFSSNTAGREDAWCTLSSMPFTLRAGVSDIPVGSTAPVQSSGGGVVPLVVPEEQADAVIAALTSPTAWVLGRTTGEGRLMDCLLESGSYYLSRATIDTGCTAD